MVRLKILIACEFSGIVRDAFIARGHDAMSCDLLPTERPGPHYQGDVMDILDDGWDMMIAHPPCTYLTTAANRAHKMYPQRESKRNEAFQFFMSLYNARGIKKICIENPKGVVSTLFRKPNQYIHPYYFGHTESKKTGLWLRGLPRLNGTDLVEPEWIISSNGDRYSPSAWKLPSTNNPENAKLRSKTFPGIAAAMAAQWSEDLTREPISQPPTDYPQPMSE